MSEKDRGRKSLKKAAQRATSEDANERAKFVPATRGGETLDEAAASTRDSFQNFAAKMGVGTDNLLSASTYGFNPISRNRNLLDWIHRGSWIGGVAVDLVADDMTKAGIELVGKLPPDSIEKINESAVALGIWPALNDAIKWSRLYGGSIAVMMIDGQDAKTPLQPDRIAKGQFKGLLPLDRWMVEASLGNVVTEMGPHIGLPKFYRVSVDAAGMQGQTVHYTRCIRMEGVRVPYWQRLQENLWGMSVLERLYDRMVAFDSASTGAAQLVYKSYLRTLKVDNLREIAGTGGKALEGLVQYVDVMRRFQSIEGLTLIDGKDEFGEGGASSSFSGLGEALMQFGQQLSGALQIPLVRLFGQSPSGLNSSGESDLRTYYDGIKQQQERSLKVPVTFVCRMIARSLGVDVEKGFGINFRSLWQMTDEQKATIAGKVAETVSKVEESAIIDRATALKELRQSSAVTGIFTNITDEDIEEAEAEPLPMLDENGDPLPDAGDEAEEDRTSPSASSRDARSRIARVAASDSDSALLSRLAAIKRLHGLDIVIENPKHSVRTGGTGEATWRVSMPTDYGYVRRTSGADGDQLDCFVGPDNGFENVWIIDQRNLDTGAFDEHKCMIGYPTREDALADYVKSYSDGRGKDRIGSISELSSQQFREWMSAADLKKPSSSWFNNRLRIAS